MAAGAIPSLSIVIPVYNEAEWIGRCVDDAVTAVGNSPFARDAELVIVDDGSDQATKDAIRALAPAIRTRVLTQENRGRFAARAAGIEAARGDLVFLLDSRIFMEPDSLGFVAARLDGERLPAWNGHVEIDVERNPFARFWRTITFAGWRDYLANPRTTSFGLEEYDRYPKGTGCFLAPRASLLSALGDFRSIYNDLRLASDDTLLIRSIAAEQPINISPGFACSYSFPRSLRRFLRHAFHRGTTFVDSFGRPGTRFFWVLVAFFPMSLLFAAVAVWRPRAALALIATGPFAAGAGVAALRRPPADVFAFSALIAPFALAYSAGLWRGGLMAARARIGT
jgi:glycosyltransferase involved in cell wall biosynthesis